jgi:hypothetical protein
MPKPRGGATIPCPACGTPSRVIQTRRVRLTQVIRRWRICPRCQLRFNTTEVHDSPTGGTDVQERRAAGGR